MSVEASSDLEELFRLNITFDIPKGLTIETRNTSDRARRVRQATTVTKWRNTTCLGQGASGVVWLQQEDEVPETCRAIKQIPKGTRSAPLPVDYRRELLALGRLSKRDDLFVRFLGWYEDTQWVYLAMEYFEQGDLGRHLSAPLAEDEVRVISKQLLEGLTVLHGQNWAHRDLKPANIFVVDTSPWWVKIGDFGISKRIRSGNTKFQTMIGTYDFVAPEVLNLVSEVDDEDTGDDEDEYTVAVDMWSLGCVIFQLLTLETPFANRKKLGSYCRYKLEKFPLAPLEQATVGAAATKAIKGLLEPIPSQRTTADATLRCEWIQGLPASSDNDYVSQDTKQNTGMNQGFRAGLGIFEAFNSITGHNPEPPEEVQANSLEDNSNMPESSHVLQTLHKAQPLSSHSSYENVPKFNQELELNIEAAPSSTHFSSDVAKDSSSEHGDKKPSISKLLDQQRRSISRKSYKHGFIKPPPTSICSPNEQRGGPALVRAFEKLSTTKPQTFLNIGTPCVPEDVERKYQHPQSTGARKALLIGENPGVNFEEVKGTAQSLVSLLGYRSEDVAVVDCADHTKEAITWLSHNLSSSDSIFVQLYTLSTYDALVGPLLRRCSRVTFIFDSYIYPTELRLNHIYRSKWAPKRAGQEQISLETRGDPGSNKRSNVGSNKRLFEGDIIIWYLDYGHETIRTPRRKPLSANLMKILQCHQETYSTPTYKQILQGLQMKCEESFTIDSIATVYLTSNHPIDLNSPFFL